MSDETTGVLLMAYGTPETLDQVEPYFTHIRGGRPPSPAAVAHLRHRYELVGGRTPLLDITAGQRHGLELHLNAPGGGHYRVYAGMKHWHPYIGEVMAQMQRDGVRQLIAVPLAPHYSRLSIGGYRKAVDEAQTALGMPFTVTFVESWHHQPAYLDLVTRHVQAALHAWPAAERDEVLLVFTAHSLPERIRSWDDPYERELLASSAGVVARLGDRPWRFAWQSAGNTGEPWLGPDIGDYLEQLKAEGVRAVLVVPIGFVCDHLEISYDIDYEAQNKARELGLTLHRTAMPNNTPSFIRALATVVAAAEAGSDRRLLKAEAVS